MITKAVLMKSIDDLPNSFAIDELIDKLLFIEKVQKGLEQSKDGTVFTKEEARKKLDKWLK